jgi:hypothetical protein
MEGSHMTTIDETVSLAGPVSRDGETGREAPNQRSRELIAAWRRVPALMPTADDRAGYEALGVDNRFAAGDVAAKRGWS